MLKTFASRMPLQIPENSDQLKADPAIPILEMEGISKNFGRSGESEMQCTVAQKYPESSSIVWKCHGQQQIKEIADRFITELRAIEDGDASGVERIVELFADNAELTNPLIEREGTSRSGRDQIADFWREYNTTFKNIHSEFFDITASEHSAGLFWRSAGTNATGQPLEYEGVSLLVLDEAGKIARFKGYFDSRQITVPSRPQ
jgi:ketosteroid isomerase-like protein